MRVFKWLVMMAALAGSVSGPAFAADLETEFENPSLESAPWVFWRWRWDYADRYTKAGITDELEAMAEQGIGGVNIDCVGGRTPKNAAPYMSEGWLDLVDHAHQEAQRLGIEFYMHACDGWANTGGPWIEPEDAMKVYTSSKTQVKGPSVFNGNLPVPDASLLQRHQNATLDGKPIEEFYRDVAVLAYDNSSPNTVRESMINLTDKMSADGYLRWEAPAGDWTILRFGWKITGSQNAPATPEGTGLECDKLSPIGIDAHLAAIEPLIQILENRSNGVQSFLGSDSWEAKEHSWTQSMPEDFKAAKGYDLLPWLPVLADENSTVLRSSLYCTLGGRRPLVVNHKATAMAARFLEDYNDQLDEMVRDNWALRMREKMNKRGILTQCQSFPEFANMSSGEFWAVTLGEAVHGPWANFFTDDPLRSFGVPNHVPPRARGYGNNITAAETLTCRSQNWERTPYAQKAAIDWALCAGINKIVFHLYAMQPDSERKPHYLGCGTTVNRNLTWWPLASGWFDYIARVQFMMRRGNHVSDVCFMAENPRCWPGGHFAQTFPAPYRFDITGWDRIVNDMQVVDGNLTFPEGTNYRLLVLPNRPGIRPETIRKVKALIEKGAVVLAERKPFRARGLVGYPESDAVVQKVANELWG